jgi:preprotein translocase subunit Sec61beta
MEFASTALTYEVIQILPQYVTVISLYVMAIVWIASVIRFDNSC